MATITNQGRLQCRTPLLTREEAEAKRAELASRPAFRDVELVESPRSQSDRRFFISWLPSDPTLVEALLQGQQTARDKRAASQEFTFARDDQGHLFCHSHGSGMVYSVTSHTCDCMDFIARCAFLGIRCKHLQASAEAIRQGRVVEYHKIPARAA